jgi:hypothetical protein
LLATIPPKTQEQFEDPYKYDPAVEQPTEGEGTANAPPTAREEVEDPTASFKYLLGKEHVKDSQGGDAGSLCKTANFHPYVAFIRSQFCGRKQNSISHQDVPSSSNSKQMNTFMVTTGFLVSYRNSFEVEIFNI